ncbi:MAG: UBP-type zinc finger domain-containing protein [Acidobacteriales bacterium]|nr:UBP-type zinc finger domain-containing protein [Terriglobales bacterium]
MKACEHLRDATDREPASYECPECVALQDRWVHLRICLICGHVGCCDSSKNKHATKHFHSSHHAIIRSIEPGETWGWCYVDQITYNFSRGVEHAAVEE